jgi:aryl-alcohol dehydrogenase-like predicted oxidoreductase
MEARRTLGALTVSVAGLGCNNFGRRMDALQSAGVVDAALDLGVTFFDTADVYGEGRSEEYLGAALGSRRDQVVVATKFGNAPAEGLTGGSPAWVRQAAEASLRRLGSDWVDLLWLHRPDPEVPIDDTLEAMNQLVREGKVREIACSNFSSEQLDEAAAAADERGLRPFAGVQNAYSLLNREPEREVLPACARLGLGFVPFFPLESGLLTGKYRRDEEPPEGTRLGGAPAQMRDRFLSPERFDQLERASAFASDHNHTLHELALSWLAANPTVVSVIAGATSPEQVRANTAALQAWDLSEAERAELDAVLGA